MLDVVVIRESECPWVSPLVITRKKDNSLRLCIDLCQVNLRTKCDAYNLPRIEESLNMLAEATYVSSLALKSCFWRVEVAEEHKEHVAFSAGPLGLFKCNVMPFGVTNGPATL